MEDFSEARIDDVDGEKVGMFGVYDGMYYLVTLKVVPISLFLIVSALLVLVEAVFSSEF
jgi:hypothetical protein